MLVLSDQFKIMATFLEEKRITSGKLDVGKHNWPGLANFENDTEMSGEPLL